MMSFRVDGYANLVLDPSLIVGGCPRHCFDDANTLDASFLIEVTLGIAARDGTDKHHLRVIRV